jgi:hypothetical protein
VPSATRVANNTLYAKCYSVLVRDAEGSAALCPLSVTINKKEIEIGFDGHALRRAAALPSASLSVGAAQFRPAR